MNTVAAVQIQPCVATHVTAVQLLLLAAGWRGQSLPSKDAITASLAYVALMDGVPVGFIRALSDWETVVYVSEVVVDAGHRGQGIGDALLDAVAAAVPSARIDLLSTETAKGFYEKAGFAAKSGYRRWPA